MPSTREEELVRAADADDAASARTPIFIAVPARIVERNCFAKPPDVSYVEGGLSRAARLRRAFDRDACARSPSRHVAVLGNGGFGILARTVARSATDRRDALRAARRATRSWRANSASTTFDTRRCRCAKRSSSAPPDAAPTRSSSAPERSKCGRARPSFVRRGGTVSFFAGLPGDARVSFLGRAAALRRSAAARAVSLHAEGRARGLRSDRAPRSPLCALDLAHRIRSVESRRLRRISTPATGMKARDRTVSARTMRAAVLYDVDDVRIEEAPGSQLAEGEMLVRTMASGICSGDVMPWYIRRKAPLVLGHEPAGIVAEARGDGTPFRVGDRVFVHHHAPCFECRCVRARRVRAVRDLARDARSTRAALPNTSALRAANLRDTLVLPPACRFSGCLARRAARLRREVAAPQRRAAPAIGLRHRARRHGADARAGRARARSRGFRRATSSRSAAPSPNSNGARRLPSRRVARQRARAAPTS